MDRLLHFIQQAGVLMQMPRSHKKNLGNTYDTVASHSHHVSVIAYAIAKEEGLSETESLRCMAMAVFHDMAEARTGDMDFIAKHYVEVDEDKAKDAQFAGLSFSKDLTVLLDEYEARSSLIAKCAKDADGLEQMYQEWQLMWQGNKIAQKWFESDLNDRVPNFYTQTTKRIATELKESWPNDWWWSEFMEQDVAKDITKLIGKQSEDKADKK